MKLVYIKNQLFNIILLLFLLFFLYNLYNYSLMHSLLHTLLAWASIVVATPFPAFGSITSSPINIYLNIPIYVSQIFASILSLFLIFTYTSYAPSIISKIINKKMYSIFAISIVSSITSCMILDNIINYTKSTKINPVSMLILVIVTLILVYMYTINIIIAGK